ncbi:baseplate J/gp47 family protein [Thalassomonas actiniarum]|uniref:Baseplate J/gp47 family protein n=1 Tax=Thalassomonas actiniarum TaxID=485447 RepID=A0AAF0C2D6_9GAMM|nr:baseplate J/gp47 family protein [Thalassomonas actiniarum]WDD98377.1 baseplate J/gp47 family protein [Thalassomonas actiniarum]
MTAFKLLDLSKVPVPDVISSPDFETTYQELKDILIGLKEEYRDVLALESDPLAKALQVFAYREILLEAKINDATRANMLATATANDLDAIGARYNVERLVIQEANVIAVPPVAQVLEQDNSYRRRIQMAFDGLNTAGSDDAYVFHALSASGEVLDVDASSPSPCHMVVTVLGRNGNGIPDNNVLVDVRRYFGLSDDGSQVLETASKVRPLGDKVSVVAAQVVEYPVEAVLTILPGPSGEVIQQAAEDAVWAYVRDRHKLGYDVTQSGLYAALHQAGVHSVELITPTADLKMNNVQAAYCSGVQVTIGGVDV